MKKKQITIDEIRDSLLLIPDHDPIKECGTAALDLLSLENQRPFDLISLAHRKLYAFPYKQVPVCWRRLYEEASLWLVLAKLSTQNESLPKSNEPLSGALKRAHDGKVKGSSAAEPRLLAARSNEAIVTEVVRILDMALILSGAPLRATLIHRILDSLASEYPPSDSFDLVSVPTSFPAVSQAAISKLIASKLKSSSSSSSLIPRSRNPSLIAFQSHLDSTGGPLIITDSLTTWPALSSPSRSWSNPRYLMQATICGRRLVPIELGRSYTDADWTQKIVTFGEYMTQHLLTSPPPASEGDKLLPPDHNAQSDHLPDVQGTNAPRNPTAYLAQHDLLTQIPSLSLDVQTPDYVYADPSPTTPDEVSLPAPLQNAWLGPAGTVSPLHTDPYHNILCQVVGRKYIRLYPPSESERLYPLTDAEETKGVDMGNTSGVDLGVARRVYDSPDSCVGVGDEMDGRAGGAEGKTIGQLREEFEENFPRFKDARYFQGVLCAGECLYIPAGWWHYVESLEVSFNVSYWFT